MNIKARLLDQKEALCDITKRQEQERFCDQPVKQKQNCDPKLNSDIKTDDATPASKKCEKFYFSYITVSWHRKRKVCLKTA